MENQPSQPHHAENQTPLVHDQDGHHSQHEHKSSNLKSKWPFLIIALLLLLLLAFGGYIVMNQNKTTPTPTPTPEASEPTSIETEEASPTPTPRATKSFTSAKLAILSFSGYSLSYPEDWILSENRDESVPISTVTLTKDGYVLKIYQAATGGAMCIYEGDMPEGPASDYRNNEFKDLVTGFGTLRQTQSPSGGKMSYFYCQKSTSENSFGQPTSVGHMSVATQVANPDQEIISEIEEIVKSIKTN